MDSVIEALKESLIKLGTEQIMKFLIAQSPVFNLPIIGPIAAMAIGYILKVLIRETEIGAHFIYFDIYTKEQASKFEEAAKKHKEAIKNGTREEKERAERDLIDAARNLIRLAR